jgi:hypothetical protein
MQATSKEGKEGGIELIQPPANSKPGDRVYFEGSDFEGGCIISRKLKSFKAEFHSKTPSLLLSLIPKRKSLKLCNLVGQPHFFRPHL